MKNTKLFIMIIPIIFLVLGFGGGNSSGNSYQWDKPWTLVWEDNFDGTSLDTNSWTALVRGESWNNENQAYLAENATIENGLLVLTSKKENYNGPSGRVDHPDQIVTMHYTSAQVETTHKKHWTYGKFEIRAKPVTAGGNGMLSAIWMVPEDEDWPPEIDIMEMRTNDPDRIYMTSHYGTPENHLMNSGVHIVENYNFGDDFHVFGLEWEPGVIRWYIDGVQRYETKKGVPNEPFRLILCPAIGPDWTGDPDENLQFPNRFEIDWVKVYQRQ